MAFQLPMAVQMSRLYQIQTLGWDAEWCDQWKESELYRASTAYCARWRYGQTDPENDPGQVLRPSGVPVVWPFPEDWWAPRNCVADLARAGAFLVAEVDRRGRAGEPWSAVSERLTEVVNWGRMRRAWP